MWAIPAEMELVTLVAGMATGMVSVYLLMKKIC